MKLIYFRDPQEFCDLILVLFWGPVSTVTSAVMLVSMWATQQLQPQGWTVAMGWRRLEWLDEGPCITRQCEGCQWGAVCSFPLLQNHSGRVVSNFTHFVPVERRTYEEDAQTPCSPAQTSYACLLCPLLSTISEVSFDPHPVVFCCSTGSAQLRFYPAHLLSKPELHSLQQVLVPAPQGRCIFPL